MYVVLAYYGFVKLDNPHKEVADHLALFQDLDVRARIYISEEGINGQMSASEEHAKIYKECLHARAPFQDIVFKEHTYHEHAFPRKTVKYRKQLVALDATVDMAKTGERLLPKQWKEKLEHRDENMIVLDVRNQYEWVVGRFKGAEMPPLETFREFPLYAKQLKEKKDPEKTTVLMYCTGGIRCELYSALLKEEGFDKVYQLDGGVIGYGLNEGSSQWEGKLFVFDDRMVVPIAPGENPEPISSCAFCDTPSDTYYNCANMDCNELFLSCPTCAEKMRGCCCTECIGSSRVRAFSPEVHPKPFRRITKTA